MTRNTDSTSDKNARRQAKFSMKQNPKDKLHQFLVTVRTLDSRKSAYYSVLTAFGMRQPDYCKFYLHYQQPSLSARAKNAKARKRKKK